MLFFAIFATVPLIAQESQAPGTTRFAVVLDAAHGGDDLGAKLGSQSEKDLTLALSVKLRSLLAARGISVVTTRESDVDVDADHRAEIANYAKASACLNLHAAPASGKNPSAVHLFLSSLPAAKDAPLMPWRTAQSAWVARSTELAGVLNSALTQAGISVTLGRTALPAIDSMACPAVAVEVAPQLAADAQETAGADGSGFVAKVADALAAALVEWRSNGAQFGEKRP
ncbi:MAG: N-acetylmuramoyl-L-alanine amidase family protein [Terracidiphilus sp.]